MRGVRGNRVEAAVIHGRTKQGRYTKLADWEYVRIYKSILYYYELLLQLSLY